MRLSVFRRVGAAAVDLSSLRAEGFDGVLAPLEWLNGPRAAMRRLGGEGLRLVPQITVAAASPGAAVDALAAGLDVVADALAAEPHFASSVAHINVAVRARAPSSWTDDELTEYASAALPRVAAFLEAHPSIGASTRGETVFGGPTPPHLIGVSHASAGALAPPAAAARLFDVLPPTRVTAAELGAWWPHDADGGVLAPLHHDLAVRTDLLDASGCGGGARGAAPTLHLLRVWHLVFDASAARRAREVLAVAAGRGELVALREAFEFWGAFERQWPRDRAGPRLCGEPNS